MDSTYITRKSFVKRVLCAVLCLLILCGSAAFGEYDYMMKNARPAVITENTRVYREDDTSSKYWNVRKGMKINLLGINGDWALVENHGTYGFMNADKVALQSAQPKPDYDELMKDAKDAVITRNTRVYKSASTSAKYWNVKKGMKVKLVAVKGDWAMVENHGTFGYMNPDHVSAEPSVPAPTPTPTPVPTPEPEQPDYSHLLPNAKKAVLTADAKVYKFADTSSSYVSAPKGTDVKLLGVKDGWALVEMV